MKVCFYHNDEKNFGDDLNAWLFPRVLPDVVSGYCAHGDEFVEDNNREPSLIYGIGTVLDHRIPPAPIKYILGSGVGYYNKPDIDDNYRFYFVRGPKSAQALGLDKNIGLNDPAILLTQLIEKPAPKFDYSLIMHCDTAKSDQWEKIASQCGFNYVDPRADDPLSVINALIASKHVITESLHGAIIADAFGVPWLPITSMPHINNFKWQDWCAATKQQYSPLKLHPIYRSSGAPHKSLINLFKSKLNAIALRKTIKNTPFFLSDRDLLSQQLEEMNNRLNQFKTDIKA